jgi:hypothetical protein
MNYQGLHPQPGKGIGEGYRAYKLAAQKKTRTLHVLPWDFLLDPGYYHGMAEDHSLPAADGVAASTDVR